MRTTITIPGTLQRRLRQLQAQLLARSARDVPFSDVIVMAAAVGLATLGAAGQEEEASHQLMQRLVSKAAEICPESKSYLEVILEEGLEN